MGIFETCIGEQAEIKIRIDDAIFRHYSLLKYCRKKFVIESNPAGVKAVIDPTTGKHLYYDRYRWL